MVLSPKRLRQDQGAIVVGSAPATASAVPGVQLINHPHLVPPVVSQSSFIAAAISHQQQVHQSQVQQQQQQHNLHQQQSQGTYLGSHLNSSQFTLSPHHHHQHLHHHHQNHLHAHQQLPGAHFGALNAHPNYSTLLATTPSPLHHHHQSLQQQQQQAQHHQLAAAAHHSLNHSLITSSPLSALSTASNSGPVITSSAGVGSNVSQIRQRASSVSPPGESGGEGQRGSPVSGTVTSAAGTNGGQSSVQCNGTSAGGSSSSSSVASMDNSMGQMGQMAPLGLSQSMDSVNTASNEEEVGE